MGRQLCRKLVLQHFILEGACTQSQSRKTFEAATSTSFLTPQHSRVACISLSRILPHLFRVEIFVRLCICILESIDLRGNIHPWLRCVAPVSRQRSVAPRKNNQVSFNLSHSTHSPPLPIPPPSALHCIWSLHYTFNQPSK